MKAQPGAKPERQMAESRMGEGSLWSAPRPSKQSADLHECHPGHFIANPKVSKDKVPWTGRAISADIPFSADRNAVFPLPALGWRRNFGGESRKAGKRFNKFRNAFVWGNECIDALNDLYGCETAPAFVPLGSNGEVGGVSPCHASIHSHILSAVLDSYPDFEVPSPRAAVGQLLGRRLTYDGGDSSVEPYCEGRVSLPSGTIKPVALAGVLSSDVFASLCPEKMLAEQEVVDFRQKFESVGMYTDIVLSKNKNIRRGFFKRLSECGILGFSRTSKALVSPFFVSKKNGKQRLVLDCRRVNQLFRKPHRPDLGPAEALQRIEQPGEEPIFEAEADLKNCFYQCGIDPWLMEYFCFDDLVPGSFAQDIGVTLDIHGQEIGSSEVYPCLTVLPMGFNWSFWIVQEMVTNLCEKSGLPRDRILVSGWPAPSIKEGVIGNPYCDNLNLFGLQADEVNAQLRRLISVFENHGFELHEIEWARLAATPLGCRFDGRAGVVSPKLEKLHRLRRACQW